MGLVGMEGWKGGGGVGWLIERYGEGSDLRRELLPIALRRPWSLPRLGGGGYRMHRGWRDGSFGNRGRWRCKARSCFEPRWPGRRQRSNSSYCPEVAVEADLHLLERTFWV